jgi:hypothetical protein
MSLPNAFIPSSILLLITAIAAPTSFAAPKLEQYPAIDSTSVPDTQVPENEVVSTPGSKRSVRSRPKQAKPPKKTRAELPSKTRGNPVEIVDSAPKSKPSVTSTPVAVGAAAVSATPINEETQRLSQEAGQISRKAKGFDSVAANQVESIAQRIQLVEAILRRHSRAYDYRVYSARELRSILSSLDAAAVKTAPSEEAPQDIPITSADDTDTASSEDESSQI